MGTIDFIKTTDRKAGRSRTWERSVWVQEKCRNMGGNTHFMAYPRRKGKPTYIAFVDLKKAFDNVVWNKLFQVLKQAGVKYMERKVIYNFCKNQTAVVRVEGHERDAVVGKGVR